MAFIGEDQRFKSTGRTEVSPGPIYNPEKGKYFKSEEEIVHNLAPFGSNVDRLNLIEYEEKVLNKEIVIPEKKQHKEVFEYIRQSSSFANQADRFNYDIERSPGPGYYKKPGFVGENFLKLEKQRLKAQVYQIEKEKKNKFLKDKRQELQKSIKKEFFKEKREEEFNDYSENNMMKIPVGRGPNVTFVNEGKVKSLLADKYGRYVGFNREKKFNRV